MKALITGATGFIGGALASALVEAGWSVRVVIRPGAFHRLHQPERFDVIEANLHEPGSLRPILIRPDEVIVHAGAIRNRWKTAAKDYYTVNVEATRQLLYASLGRAQRFVYISSAGVFGRPGVLDINENFSTRLDRGKWNYYSTKLEGERVVMARNGEIEVVVVRPTITYGPGDQDGMVSSLIQTISRRQFVRMSPGYNYVHLTYIDDLIRGLKLAMTHQQAPKGTFILAGEEPIQMRTLLMLLESRLGVPLPQWNVPIKLANALGRVCEFSFRLLPGRVEPPITRDKVANLCANRGFSWAKAAHELGFTPQISYEQGLDRTLEWLSASKRLDIASPEEKAQE